jgi:hypothetical protein
MRTRAYRPEAPACLEDRSLLSGFAGPSHEPVVLLNRQLDKVIDHMESSFLLVARNGLSVPHLRQQLRDVAVIIPFGRVDGLGVSIKRIVNRMQHDLAAGVPHPIRSASEDAVAATRATVKARVEAGDVVVR